MTENEKNQRLEAKNNVSIAANQKVSSLLRTELGEDLSFETGIHIIESYIQLFKNLASCDFDEIPLQQISRISTIAIEAKNLFDEISIFSLQKYPNNPITTRNVFLENLQNQYGNAVTELAYIAAYYKEKVEIESYQVEAQNSIEEIRALKKELQENKELVTNELSEILEKARQTISEVGVASHAIHFKNEATENLNESKNWLIALICVVVLTIIWGIACFFIHPESDKSSDIVQFTIAKLIIISGLYFALSMITKNYKAHRHNYIVNKHKQNSLNSFEAFVKGAGEDIQTKNAVLISATQSIFSAQPSGYSNQDPDTEPSKIIEILKTTNSSK
jgi:hypothetical protein